MNTNEALEQIREIHKVIEGSNRAIFSGERMIFYGVLIALIPAIEWATQGLTFGAAVTPHSAATSVLLHVVFYLGLFPLLGKLLPYKKTDHADAHPLIQKAFNVKKQFLAALFGIIFALALIGQGQLIHPMVFILLGFLYSLYGQFSAPAVSVIAWSYIVIGIAYAFLTKFNLEHLWVWLTIYNGLSFVAMGVFLRREQASPA